MSSVPPPHFQTPTKDQPSRITPANYNTPNRTFKSHGPGSFKSGLKTARDNVADDIGPIPEVSVEFFLQSCMPESLPEDFDSLEVLNSLRDAGIIKITGGANGVPKREYWDGYYKTPSESSASEAEYFSKMDKLFLDIVQHSKPFWPEDRKADQVVLGLKSMPSTTAASEASNSSRCDGAVLVSDNTYTAPSLKGDTQAPVAAPDRMQTRAKAKEEAEDEITQMLKKMSLIEEGWHLFALHLEYKKFSTPEMQKDNYNKMVWGGNHNLRNDPRRGSALGVTIEDEIMRLWRFTRAGVVVSAPINWFKDHGMVVKIFSLIAAANRTELGWDPNVERVLVDGEIQYKYKVQGKYYITFGSPLCNFRADLLLGRATRVLQVYPEGTNPIKDPGVCMALKDMWIKEGTVAECQFLTDIRAKMTDDEKNYFLTPHAFETVHVPSKGGMIVDSTRNVIRKPLDDVQSYYLVEYQPPKSNKKAMEGTTHEYSSGMPEGLKPEVVNAVKTAAVKVHNIYHRDHIRSIFVEVCSNLHDMFDLRTMFSGLLEASRGLEILHKLGYVHRDISTGNILWWIKDGKGRAKIADLEYHKKSDAPFARDDFRTGTIQFLPIEVHGEGFLVNTKPPVKVRRNRPDGYNSAEEDRKRREARGSKAEVKTSRSSNIKKSIHIRNAQPPFRYNFVHDLESLFWIALWIILHYLPSEGAADYDNADFQKQITYASEIFPNDPSKIGYKRYNVILGRDALDHVLECVHPKFQYMADDITQLRYIIYENHRKYQENNDPEAIMQYEELMYSEMRDYLRSIVDNTSLESDLVFIPTLVEEEYNRLKKAMLEMRSMVPPPVVNDPFGGPANATIT